MKTLIVLLLLTVRANAFSIGTRARLPQKSANVDGRVSAAARHLRSAPTDVVQVTEEVIPSVVTTDAIICGGGPAGLLSAIMLAQKFPEVRVNDVSQEVIGAVLILTLSSCFRV